MLNYLMKRLVMAFVFPLVVLTSNFSFADVPKKIFIIHSYEQDHVCGQPQHDGAMKAMAESGLEVGNNLDLAVYYMDTKRKNNTPELIKLQAEAALKKIEKFQPDVILTLDDNAFKTVALPLAGSEYPIVFSGVNGQPETYNKINRFMENREQPGYNITGIYEKLHIQESIRVLSKMFDLNKVIILDDLSSTGRAISVQVDLELFSEQGKTSFPCDCEIEKRTITSWEEYKEFISRVNSDSEIDAFYLASLLLKDAEGNAYTAPDIVDYTIKNAVKPAIAPNYSFIKMGLYGGASVDFFDMGYQAGKKMVLILNGTAPGTLPIVDAQRVALAFNLSRAETLGLHIPNDILLAADEVFRK